jgi:hypothetical protein
MNELVWEGLIEILRGNQPSLKATARLWRRDDFFGSDWGGQLELPVVFRRLLPAGQYAVRLPAGSQGTVRVTAGPSTTSMTFPTLTGVGHPPFGGAEARPAVEIDLKAEEAPVTQEPIATSPSTAAATIATIEAMAPSTEPISVAASSASSFETPAPASNGAAAFANDELPAAGPRRLTLVEPVPAESESPAVAQTEAMARAFLAAVEARQRLEAVARPGFEGRAIEAARQDIDSATETLEGALRARAGTDHWPQALAEHLVALSWFASLAVPDSQPEIAGAGRAVQALVATIQMLLVASPAARVYARAA